MIDENLPYEKMSWNRSDQTFLSVQPVNANDHDWDRASVAVACQPKFDVVSSHDGVNYSDSSGTNNVSLRRRHLVHASQYNTNDQIEMA